MQELKRSHAEHDAEVRRLSKEMQRVKRRAREQGGPLKIREPQRSIVRVLVCMNNGEPTAAIEYVSRSSKSRCLDASSKRQLDAELREWWRATDVDTRQTYLVVDETNAAMHKAIVQARRFVVDNSLEAQVSVVASGMGMASGHLVERSMMEKMYRAPLETGRGPTMSTWMWPKRLSGW